MLSLGVRSITGFNALDHKLLGPRTLMPNPPLVYCFLPIERVGNGMGWDGIEGKPTNHQGSLEYPNNRHSALKNRRHSHTTIISLEYYCNRNEVGESLL